MAARNEAALSLFRRILRLHRQKLPSHLREMGDTYVKKEFRDHRKAKASFIPSFMGEWQRYADGLARHGNDGDSRFGQDMSESTVALLNEDQKASLERLRQEASSFRRPA